MVHVHGARVQAQTEILRRARLDQLVAVAADLPADWEVVELNPARVAQQRKRSGQGGVKTDLVDCAAVRVSVELAATVRVVEVGVEARVCGPGDGSKVP